MSVMKCDSCDRCIDTDENVEAVIVWAPECVCDRCFEGMDPDDVWNLALETAIHETKYTVKPDLHEAVEKKLRDLMHLVIVLLIPSVLL